MQQLKNYVTNFQNVRIVSNNVIFEHVTTLPLKSD